MHNTHLLHIALITCDDIFEAGGVGTSIVRIARGLSTQYNMQVDILMLNSARLLEFSMRISTCILYCVDIPRAIRTIEVPRPQASNISTQGERPMRKMTEFCVRPP